MRTTIARAFERGTIDAEQRSSYLATYSAALRDAASSLSGRAARRADYVIDTVRRFARQRRLTARLAPMFLILQRNRDWWAKAGPPGSGARLQLGGSRVIFQYFPGQGPAAAPAGELRQAQRLLAWDAATGICARWPTTWSSWPSSATASSPGSTTSPTAAARRRGSPAWRRGPRCRRWRAPATAWRIPRWLEVAGRARGAFDTQHPEGRARAAERRRLVRALQLRAAPVRAERASPGGERHAHVHRVRPRRHGGGRALPAPATSPRRRASAELRHGRLVAVLAARPGSRARRRASTTTRSTATSRATSAEATSDPAYCTASDHFTEYLKQDPTRRPAPRRSRSGDRRPRREVPLQALEGRPGRDRRAPRRQDLPVHERLLRHGERYIRWVPPRVSDERTYTYTLFARDLAGNSSSAAARSACRARRSASRAARCVSGPPEPAGARSSA